MPTASRPSLISPLHNPSRVIRICLWLGLYLLLALGCGECDLVCDCTEGWRCTRGCCGPAEPVNRRGCGCDWGFLEAPLDSVITAQVSAALANDETAATKLCGFDTPGLLAVSTKRTTRWLSFGPVIWVEVEGWPRPSIEADAASGASAAAPEDGSACTGQFLVVMYLWQGAWVLGSLDLVEVTTPGAEWTSASSSDDFDFDDWD